MGSLSNDVHEEEVPLCRIVTPVGMLGYGFDQDELAHGLDIALRDDDGTPVAIILDSGSTDSGPAKLALGNMTCPRSSYLRDLRKLVDVVLEYRVPLLVSSAGGDGTDAHVDEFLSIIGEIVQNPSAEDESPSSAQTCRKANLKVLATYSDIDRETVKVRLHAGRVSGCGPCVPPLTVEAIDATATIVGQVGPEPFLRAMAAHPDFDVLIGGRAYDPAPYVAFAAFHALSQTLGSPSLPLTSLPNHARLLGGFTHMGKVMECGGLCAIPKSSSALATVYVSGAFDVRPLAQGSCCTPSSVAAHTLYEKSRPDVLHGPGGYIDLSSSSYAALADGVSVRVRGTQFVASQDQHGSEYTVKLEGARVNGYRTIFMGSFGDSILIQQLPILLQSIKDYVRMQHKSVRENWELDFHIYPAEYQRTVPSEVFVVGEALAENQALATSVASTARVACAHGPYKGQKANSGNFGMGIGGKLEIEMGPCAEFSVYHLMGVDEGEEDAVEVGGKTQNDGRPHSVNKFPSLQRLARWKVNHFGSITAPTPRSVPRYCRKAIGSSARISTGPSTRTLLSNDEPKVSPRLSGIHTLGEVARIVRSKNSGPFEITLDALFEDKAVYEQVKASKALTAEAMANLYGIEVEDIVWCGFFDPALAFKVTIPRRKDGRPSSSGSFMENDVQGSQQYRPFMGFEINLGK